ncbi:hypothetical protein PGTUg99_000043 [Puccinia graminis f. sp. tritici]|uniref:Uncharacterized protein n=1 Tax=Puccinia graminis f. sp. tritici TaxID=56615 RepID=A0A5B0PGY6_PUCGR|nr:hypothetical protein PGTUg99_000043 [Puccinia graminis f. sp. tritici]
MKPFSAQDLMLSRLFPSEHGVDEEDVLRARERITRWFITTLRHNSQRVLRGLSRRARTAAANQ